MASASDPLNPQLSSISQLREIVAKLRAPDGCPWDREQTHATLRSAAIEEAYEVVEAIDRADLEHLREELGDLLLQVVMHAQIAAEAKQFDFDEIARGISEKLIRRHPHVFGKIKAADSDTVLKNWDEIKRAEREKKAVANAGNTDPTAVSLGFQNSVLDGVSAALPALMRAEKVQKRAARVGFDWENLHGIVEKIREEVVEVETEIQSGQRERLEEELGDLLFAVVNLTRKAKFEAEILLNAATNKFITRFQKLESEVARRNQKLDQLTLAELDAIWEEIKAANDA